MSKFLLSVSFLCLAGQFVLGMINPANPAMWLASSSHGFNIFRLILMASLLAVFAASWFMNKRIRIVVTLLASGLIAYALEATYTNIMGFNDTLVILMSGISILLAVFEPTTGEILPAAATTSSPSKRQKSRLATV